MSDRSASPDSGDVIRPVRLDDIAPPPPPPPTGGGGWGLPIALAALAVAILLALLWFITRPSDSPAPPPPAPATTPVEPVPSAPAPGPPATPVAAAPTPAAPMPAATASPVDLARQEAEKQLAEKAMEEWSILHGHLKEHGLTLWGGEAYGGTLEKARQGDEALVRKTFTEAAARYREATAALSELNGVTNLIFHQWIDDAEQLASRGDAVEARAKVGALEQMAPGSPLVAKTREAVERALQVGERLRAGEAREKSGQWALAFVEYQEAAALDPAHAGAAAALERARKTMAGQEFRGMMTDGLAALRQMDFDAAEGFFAKARDLQPDSPEIRDALQQVTEGRRNARIEKLKAAAAAAEKAEDWDLAFRTHGEALNVDAGLVFAQAGRERAQQAAQAVKRMEFFLRDPRALQGDRGLEEARAALAAGRAVSGGPKLAATVEDLARRIEAAATLVPVTLRSDGATRVAVFKHGQFEPFTEKRIELRPGAWTITGNRNGYRDVRLTLEIANGDGPKTLDVSCTEKVR